MMMPVMPSPKRPSCFSIDALMSKVDSRGCDSAQTSPTSTIPCSSPQMCPSTSPERDILSARGALGMPLPGGRAPPPHMMAAAPHPAFLHGVNTVYPGGLPPGFDAATAAAAAATHPLLSNPAAASALLANGALPPALAAGLPGRPLIGGPHPPPGHPMHHPSMMGAPQPKDGVPFYTWLLSRHGNLLGQRFAGVDAAAYLFPFRKPKRIRTAFSPTQLLQLEHAFEKNHYVVGQERKELAANLNLTETQVKVWFQNRRTKHKRVATDDESEGGANGDQKSKEHKDGSDNGHESDDLVESDIDVEDEDDIDINSPENPFYQAHHLHRAAMEMRLQPHSGLPVDSNAGRPKLDIGHRKLTRTSSEAGLDSSDTMDNSAKKVKRENLSTSS